MNIFKRVVLFFFILMLAGASVVIYWNTHLYHRARNTKDTREKIEILERANRLYPLNDLVFYELGRAYFDLGKQSLDDKQRFEAHFQESIANFKRSIRINPASYFSHFRFGQALLFASYVSPSFDGNAYEEYKKAAMLLGHNHRLLIEIGGIFLSQWNDLSEKNREFTADILRKIAKGKDREKLLSLMHIWEMNVGDYGVMERILPEDADIYRMYAQFLGDKSLSLEERQKVMVRAEFMEFEEAKEECKSGEKEFLYFRVDRALKHYQSCLSRLARIKFYQSLAKESLIDLTEHDTLKKTALLNLAKCRLEERAELKEVEGYLKDYLTLEDRVAAVGELEEYLKNRGLMGENLEASLSDLDRLSFQILLYYKQNRYRDIVRMGRVFQQSFVVVPEGKKGQYVEVLQLLGDAYQKVDFVYDAGDFYRKALEIEPGNLDALLRMKQNYERLNEGRGVREASGRIEKVLAQREEVLRSQLIGKGQSFYRRWILDGRRIFLDLEFEANKEGFEPLLSVFFNGHVGWEGYLKEGRLSLPLDSTVGENLLEITAVNKAINLGKISYH